MVAEARGYIAEASDIILKPTRDELIKRTEEFMKSAGGTRTQDSTWKSKLGAKASTRVGWKNWSLPDKLIAD